MPSINRRWLLVKRPREDLTVEHLQLDEAEVPEPREGEFLVENLYLSCDPTQRGWASTTTYYPPVKIGDPMRAFALGKVVASRNPRFQPGDRVQGLFGWQEYAIMDDAGLCPVWKAPAGVSDETALSAFGITGFAAYFGLTEIGRPRPGETVVVSAAAGATGSIVCQVAKNMGCRVVGIAGGADKCAYLRDELGVDDAIDYKNENVLTRFRKACPAGVDVYFDNVGGRILEAALAGIALHARVVLCGAIAGYNSAGIAAGPNNYLRLLIQRARMEGFVVSDYLHRADEATETLLGYMRAGRLKDRVDVAEGLESAPEALARLFRGENQGKQLVRLARASVS